MRHYYLYSGFLLFLLTITSCEVSRQEESHTNYTPNETIKTDTVSKPEISKEIGLRIGQQAPDISLPDQAGNIKTLSSLRGKYILIDFWASWCGPCRMENPNVVRIYNQYKDKDFDILSVSLDNDKTKWLRAIETDGLVWNHVSDLKAWDSAVSPVYEINSIPMTYLVNKEGIIIGKNLRGSSLEKKLAEVLK